MSNPVFFGIDSSYPILEGEAVITDRDGDTVFATDKFIFFGVDESNDGKPQTIPYIEPSALQAGGFLMFESDANLAGCILYTNVRYNVDLSGNPVFENERYIFFGQTTEEDILTVPPTGLTQNYDLYSKEVVEITNVCPIDDYIIGVLHAPLLGRNRVSGYLSGG